MGNRGKTTRQQILRQCAKHKCYIFYPEGTRRAAQANANEAVPLKVGGLKNLFEANTPAHIVITVDKEQIWNEKTGHVSCQTTLYRARHPVITPADYKTLEEFLAAIDKAWRVTWQRAYALRDSKVAT